MKFNYNISIWNGNKITKKDSGIIDAIDHTHASELLMEKYQYPHSYDYNLIKNENN